MVHKNTSRPRGRPRKLLSGEPLSKSIRIRLSPPTYDKLSRVAGHQPISDFIRSLINRELRGS